MDPKGKNHVPAFQRLQSEVDRVFLELLRGERVPRYGRAAFRPNADVYYDSHEDVVVVKLELPGIDPDGVSLEVHENVLRVSGVRSNRRHPDAVYQQMEITYGRFERAIALPPEVDSARASASYSGGYMEITLPLKPETAGRRIPISVKDDPQEGQL